jgi:RHS repeat-associated protein
LPQLNLPRPIVQYEGTGTTDRRFMGSDERGSIISLTDGSGTVLTINRYDEYGKPQSTNAGRFQYTGQMWIPEVGLYYYKARFYAAHLGIFLQTDPIGGINLYAYVGNNPINATDPSGMKMSPDMNPAFEVIERELMPPVHGGAHSYDFAGQSGSSVIGGYEAIAAEVNARIDLRNARADAARAGFNLMNDLLNPCVLCLTSDDAEVSDITFNTIRGNETASEWEGYFRVANAGYSGQIVQFLDLIGVYKNGTVVQTRYSEGFQVKWGRMQGTDVFLVQRNDISTVFVKADAYYFDGLRNLPSIFQLGGSTNTGSALSTTLNPWRFLPPPTTGPYTRYWMFGAH